MPFDKTTRNRLAGFVADARRIIGDEFTEKFQSLYGISTSGEIAPIDKLTHLDDTGLATAALLRERIDYIEKTHSDDKDGTRAAVTRLAREQAFTVLNRLAAIRMAERRDLIVESVGKGYQSKGFKVFETVAGSALGDTYHRYRRYLFCLFDELAVDLGVLFDRRSPNALLFPREAALQALLALLNAPDLEHLWAEDETIGWIYQYYNDPEERKKMREESAAPRNSRELAVRNQFFTPRYVVEFLTDNTLGRIWHEMTKGQTRLKEQCRYLVRRPNEIFLGEGEVPPDRNITEDREGKTENLPQEEILRQPVHIPHRPIKDPRAILMLDPACGSMHFGLYAFDLFEVIYDEAWQIAQPNHPLHAVAKASHAFTSFIDWIGTVGGHEEFARQIPHLIIENNLHGVDIDSRAVQIAGLSLWLRAQKAWQRLGLKPAERPPIKRSNIVCAEPMPGSPELLEDFTASLDPPLLGELVKTVFEKMKLAGEAGSLLKIEEEIRAAIDEARRAWEKLQTKPRELFSTETLNRTLKPGTQQELTGIERAVQSTFRNPQSAISQDFWDTAEQRLIDALRAFAEQAENGGGFQRRLFAEDAARGFAFIDVCRKRYDVVGMNPPFGERPESCEHFFQAHFPKTVGDFFSMFFERALHLVNERGKVGAITNRTWLSLPTFEELRTKVFGRHGCVEVAADLGSFVLDAQVETAAAVIGRDVPASRMALWVRLLKTKEKNECLLRALTSASEGRHHDSTFVASQQQFLPLPASVCGYWMSRCLISLYRPENSIGIRAAEVKQGTATADDFRFLRLAWEVEPSAFGFDKQWLRFAKGGEYTPFFDDVHLALFWKNSGEEIVAWGCGRPQNTQYFGRSGVTWPRRTTSPFGPRPLPGGCAFGDKGPAAFPTAEVSPNLLLGLLTSRPARLLLSVRLGAGDDAPGSASKSYEVGLIRDLPFPTFTSEQSNTLEQATARCVSMVRSRAVEDDETTCYFICPLLGAAEKVASIRTVVASMVTHRDESFVEVCRLSSLIDETVCAALGFSETDRVVMREELELPVTAFDPDKEPDTELFKKAYLTKDAIDGEALPGGVEAEVDVRVLTRRKQQVVLRDEIKICRLFEIPPQQFAWTRQKLALLRSEDLTESIVSLVQYSLGVTFGRWDIRYATGELAAPELPDPFAPLPVCPPGMLQNAEGLPMGKDEGRRLTDEGMYPFRVSWEGILVDDENHPEDIVARVRDSIKVIWKERADAIEQEACKILGVKSLRDYFRRPGAFFADHLNRYSKSRRQAPIYWPLSTKSGSYTLWLYYPRLSDQTLHACLADFLDLKIKKVQAELDAISSSGKGGNRTGELREFLDELHDLRNEIERVIKLPWKPNLNDGVLITASPLWRLFRQPKWQKDLKACWDDLEKGEYDWAHLAHSIWPQRVEKVCEADRSIAIAHGLERLCKVLPSKTKQKLGRRKGA